MYDREIIIIGGGPAGLTAGLYLARAKRRVLLLEKDAAGGYIRNIAFIENYPGFSEGVSGAALAAQMTEQARRAGVEIENAEVTGLEVFSGTRYVTCADGHGYTCNLVIITGGSKNKKLGVPGEAELAGKGVFECALCDGSQFAGKVVAVCGGGDAGVTEALYMARIAAKVIIIEAMPELTATAILQERLMAEPNVAIMTNTRVTAINGAGRVEAVEIESAGGKEMLVVDGVLVHIGLEPNTDYLEGVLELDEHRQIIVNERMETTASGVLAAGDIRSNSPRQVVTATGDGAIAGITAVKLLMESS